MDRQGAQGRARTPMLPIGVIGLPGSLWSLKGNQGSRGEPKERSSKAILALFCFRCLILEGQEDRGAVLRSPGPPGLPAGSSLGSLAYLRACVWSPHGLRNKTRNRQAKTVAFHRPLNLGIAERVRLAGICVSQSTLRAL